MTDQHDQQHDQQNDPHPVQRETGIPIPDDVGQHRTRHPGEKYFFREMEIGDSLFMPGNFSDLDTCPMYRAASAYARRSGGTLFKFKRYPDGVRCWRVA